MEEKFDNKYKYVFNLIYSQISGSDCGLFALAYALMLCQLQEPSLV